MKIIFLDIDGVLNSDRTVLAIQGGKPMVSLFDLHVDQFDPVAIGILNRLIRKSGAKVVFSTSHRGNPIIANDRAMRFVKEAGMIDAVFDGEGPHVTPFLMHTTSRGLEIQAWLDNYQAQTGTEVEYVVLDDTRTSEVDQTHSWVLVDPAIGLSAQDYYRACKILNVTEFCN